MTHLLSHAAKFSLLAHCEVQISLQAVTWSVCNEASQPLNIKIYN